MQSPNGDASVEINVFEELLKKHNAKKPPALYSNNNERKISIQPKDVLDSVYSQIRTIQLADTRDSKVKENPMKQSTFLSVNRLPMYNEAPKPNNFETQCFSNTQLINIIDDAEALHQGMTQEFESTFLQPPADNKTNVATSTTETNQLDIYTPEFDSTFTQTNVDATISFLNDMIEREEINHDKSPNMELADLDIHKIEMKHIEVHDMKLKTEVIKPVESLKELCDKALESKQLEFSSKVMSCTVNEALNKTPVNLRRENIEIKKSDGQKSKMDDTLGACEHRSSSPVFKTKTSKMKSIQNVVVSLEDFEKFERIALPLIDIDKDLETCKHLINSQILEGELCLNAENGDIFHDDDQFSPILEKSCEIIIKDSIDKGSDSLKDEILFSSDEENDFIYKEFQDIPLTAVLETSYYDYSDVLDKTMLVGFQTANNKSIQISTDSFHKAQSILDEDNDCNNFSMKELVEIYNEKSFSKIITNTEEAKLVENNSEPQTKRFSLNNDEKPIENNEVKEPTDNMVKNPSEKSDFVGFITASNKQIKIPEKALELGKKVFMDINLENKNLIMQNDHKLVIEDLNILNKNTKDASQVENDNDDKIDDLLIQELENIEMSLEEIASKDNNMIYDKAASCINIHSEGKDDFKDIHSEGLDEIFKSDGSKVIITTTESKFVGFKTANNKNIKVSAEAMAKTKAIFEDFDTDIHKVDNDNLNDDENYKLNCNKPSASFVVFKTANNTAIKLSDAALSKSCNIIKDIDNSENMTDKPNSIELHSESINNEVIKKVLQWRKTFEYKNTGNIKDDANRSNSKSPKNTIMTLPKKSSARMKKLFENLAVKHPHDNEPNNDNSKDQNNIFKGFQTASKKPVNISDKALQKSKKIFHEVDSYNKANPFEENVATETKKTSVSHEAFARKLTNDVSFLNFSVEKGDSNNFREGFKTPSNKKVDVTKEAIALSKRILDFDASPVINKFMAETVEKHFQSSSNEEIEVSKENTKGLLNDIEITKIKDDNFKGFQTASNKKVEISMDALEKTKSIFSNIEMLEKAEQGLSGFQTAINKKVKISKEAIENTNTSFGDIALLEKNYIGNFKGFQTASNKQVKISEKALEKTKAIFSDIEIPVIEVQGCKVFDKTEISKETIEKSKALFNDIEIPDIKGQSFSGFQTASHTKVEISKEAIEKTKKLFSDFDLPENNGTFKGFQSASNKKVKSSEEALEKTRALFNDINIPDIKEWSFKGFQTASNKNVEVSKEAIEKTKVLFNEIEIPDIEEQGFRGFQTASNKNVKISEEALKTTKELFNVIEMPENKDICTYFGFQTGNKKKVTISEQALAKSRRFLQDVDKIDNDVNEEVKLNKHIKHDRQESSFKTAKNKNTNVSEDASINSKKILGKPKLTENIELPNKTKGVKSNNLDNLINTQVLDHFEKSLYTEDFNETPKRNKTSRSPILSCPRAKKRKRFEAPYKEQDKTPIEVIKAIDKPKTVATKVIFSEGYKKDKVLTTKDLPKINDTKKVIDPYILQFTLDNILNFVFEKDRNDLTDTKITITDLKEIFLSAVNKHFVPEGWLDNHIKLILWKLLSYEIKFNFKCTVQSVIDQLKYRYDKELYNAERSAFRKILEKDDVATKTMVLCVAGVYVEGTSVSSATTTDNIELLLTDGWYFIKATIDRMLSKLVADGRIVVGCKIVTSGAELANCDQGMAPWEDTSAARLKLSGNSTRPAAWHSKLGYTRAAILSHLSSVKVDGGRISRLRVFVTRVYPLLYVERFEDGSTVTRSERLEHLHQMKYEADRELMMERIYEEVQREFSDQESQDSEVQESGKRRCYDSGSQIAKMMKRSRDPMEFRAQLTSSQVHLLQDYTSKTRQKIVDTIQERIHDRLSTRNVVTLARGRIVENEGGRVSKGMLSIWKPNEDVLDLFREGASIEIMNAVPTAMRYSELQITAGRQTMFRQTKCKDNPPGLQSFKRKCYRISEVADNPSMSTEYNEIDTAGVVFLIEPPQEELKSNNNFQNVYLADFDKNMISINFWGGIKKFGFENILDTGQIVACANLQKRAGNTRKNIPQFRVTEFSSFTKTPRNIQARDVVDELTRKMYGLDRRKFCDDCIAIKNNYIAIRCLNNNENESPYRFNKSEYSFARNKMFIDTPIGVKPNRNEEANLNLTGLDFESSFKRDTQELSPNTLQRKKKVNEKIARLKMYGDPPPLSPINIINKSVNAKNSFKSPLVSDNVATPNLQNSVTVVNNLPQDSPKAIPRSPVISLKRTYVKSVPVKLNFDENKSESVDHFAEDFDASPPLSLD